jgi:arginine/lysine/ornithine decarboxylase
MTSVFDGRENLLRLAAALNSVDSSAQYGGTQAQNAPYIPKSAMPPFEAAGYKGESTALRRALGRVCLEYIWTYPPGCPLLVPGEIIDSRIIEALGETRPIEVMK